jgi:ParB-like chromosome segregation protein Spo0J
MASDNNHIAGLQTQPSTKVPIDEVRISETPRLDGENVEHVQILAEFDGTFPPIVVQRSTMRVIDGIHRLLAARMQNAETIDVEFFDGDDQSAFVLAVQLNMKHGLPLSRAERRAAAVRIIQSHPGWSDRAIAETVGLSHKTIGSIRRCAAGESSQLNTRRGRDGKVRPLDATSGRRRAVAFLTQNPSASLREVSRASGVSVGTVRHVRASLVQEAQSANTAGDAIPTPRPATEPPKGDVSPTPVEPDVRPIVEVLRADPSLRGNQLGRALLRLLDVQTLDSGMWKQLADSVPAHCTESVAKVATECSSAWRAFAEQLIRDEQTLA